MMLMKVGAVVWTVAKLSGVRRRESISEVSSSWRASAVATSMCLQILSFGSSR